MDLNHCRRKPAGLQPAPFDRSGTPPHSLATTPFGAEKIKLFKEQMVLAMGLEPATDGLQNRCSTN